MIYNFNQTIRVKLNEYGRRVLKSQLRNFDADGYYTDQLWSFMYDFGQQMYMGGPYPVESMDFELLPDVGYPKPNPRQKLLTPVPHTETELHDQIINLFLDGNSVNHIVYLLDYEVSIDVINNTIRQELARGRELRKKIRDL